MLKLFRKKEPRIPVRDLVYMDEQARNKALLDASRQNSSLSILCWFEDDLENISAYMEQQGEAATSLYTVKTYHGQYTPGSSPVFAGHYPLPDKEQEQYRRMNLAEATVYSALTDPLFRHFGGEKIISLMKQLGMKEDEVIEHALVSRSIRNAQDKIAAKAQTGPPDRSLSGWIKNLGL